MESDRYYLIHLWGMVEPSVINPTEPLNSRGKILALAREFACDDEYKKGRDAIFYICVSAESTTAGSFTAGELEEE